MKRNVKKGIVFLAAVGLLLGMALPVLAAEEIHTFKGDQEIVLTEADAVDLTKEELAEKTQSLMKDLDNYALFMDMDVEANVAYDVEGTQMSMDLLMKMSMSDNKNNGLEYELQKMSMSMMGMNTEESSEKYTFENAAGKKVSVKKEISNGNTQESSAAEDSAEWIAEAVEEEPAEADGETEEAETSNTMVSDELLGPFELLEKKYTDGEKNYYVMKAKTSDVMGTGFGGVNSIFGNISSDAECYMLFAEDGMIESLYMDLNGIDLGDSMGEGTKGTFSKFVLSMYTDESSEIVIPEEVQAAGDTVA